MCLFQSSEDIPPLVRLSLRTLQYLVIPLLSISLIAIGSIHIDQCPAQPLLPVWHVVAGASGLLVPSLYLLFDNVNPRLSRAFPACSETLDNLVFMAAPVYVTFEVAWLIAGSVWLFGTPGIEDPRRCEHTVFIFSVVVVVNFWIHMLTPLAFVTTLGCSRLFPYCGYCAYWNIVKKVTDRWTRGMRLALCSAISIPLGLTMLVTGAVGVSSCEAIQSLQHQPSYNASRERGAAGGHVGDVGIGSGSDLRIEEEDATALSTPPPTPPPQLWNLEVEESGWRIAMWLLVAGCAIILSPGVYLIYDKYCKAVEGGPLVQRVATSLVIGYLLAGLAW